MEAVKNSIDKINSHASRVVRYKYWKQPLYKWDQYIANRHRANKHIDEWSKYCLDNIKGKSAVYNSGGLYLKDFDQSLTVIEQYPCPIDVGGMEYTNSNFEKFNNKFDSIIMMNPISMKYNHSILDFLTVKRQSRAGFKGNILKWLRPNARIFLSFSDWHMFYDRLRYSLDEAMDHQFNELSAHNIECLYKKIEPSNVDIINGNVKLVLEIRPNQNVL